MVVSRSDDKMRRLTLEESIAIAEKATNWKKQEYKRTNRYINMMDEITVDETTHTTVEGWNKKLKITVSESVEKGWMFGDSKTYLLLIFDGNNLVARFEDRKVASAYFHALHRAEDSGKRY